MSRVELELRVTVAGERAAETGYARMTFRAAPDAAQVARFVETALEAMRAKNPKLNEELK